MHILHTYFVKPHEKFQFKLFFLFFFSKLIIKLSSIKILISSGILCYITCILFNLILFLQFNIFQLVIKLSTTHPNSIMKSIVRSELNKRLVLLFYVVRQTKRVVPFKIFRMNWPWIELLN